MNKVAKIIADFLTTFLLSELDKNVTVEIKRIEIATTINRVGT